MKLVVGTLLMLLMACSSQPPLQDPPPGRELVQSIRLVVEAAKPPPFVANAVQDRSAQIGGRCIKIFEVVPAERLGQRFRQHIIGIDVAVSNRSRKAPQRWIELLEDNRTGWRGCPG